MKIKVRWYAGKEYQQLTSFSKYWEFDISDFNGEVPRLGDKLSLSLPIKKNSALDLPSRSNPESSSWIFQVTERIWEPEAQ
jgi:hypothetical protein